ncbi:MAG: TAXI family TRAP transporter solute-binding subunit [Alphaproteobacteria bacterium]|nr:TAXI family TRAP transporter solute-binding subunit [Alphaproteobacteria bacterium]
MDSKHQPISKVRRHSRRRVLQGGAAVAVAGGLGALPLGSASASRILQMGSASLGSTGYVIVETISAIVNRYSKPKLRTSSMSTGGGAENMALIGEGLIQFGQTTSADWHPAMNGLPPYKKRVKANQMFSYMVWSPVPFVRADSDIRTLSDLAGKRVSTGKAGGSATRLWKELFKSAGILDKVKLTHAGWRGAYDAFKQGSIDATTAILTNGTPSPLLQELETTVKIRVLEVPETLLKSANDRNPGVLSYELTPEKWPTVQKPMIVPAYAGIFAAHPDIDAETAYNVTKSLYDNSERAQKVSKLMRNIRLDFATRYLMPQVPVNAGAAQYFKEKGVWRQELKIAT